MTAISVMLLSFRMEDGDNWWLKVCIRGAVLFGLIALAKIDAAAVVLGAIMVFSTYAAVRLYVRDLKKQKAQKLSQMKKTAAAHREQPLVLFMLRFSFCFQNTSSLPA